MGRWLSFLSRLFSANKNPSCYPLDDAYSGLRGIALSMTPEKLGLTLTKPDEVWGVLMETGYPQAVASLAAFASDDVSLYFSSGGGIIGLGSHLGPKQAAESFLATAQQFVQQMQPTKSFPLPQMGATRFYVLTVNGAHTAVGKEDDLGYGRHLLSPLFHKGHELITEIRKVDEQLRGRHQAQG